MRIVAINAEVSILHPGGSKMRIVIALFVVAMLAFAWRSLVMQRTNTVVGSVDVSDNLMCIPIGGSGKRNVRICFYPELGSGFDPVCSSTYEIRDGEYSIKIRPARNDAGWIMIDAGVFPPGYSAVPLLELSRLYNHIRMSSRGMESQNESRSVEPSIMIRKADVSSGISIAAKEVGMLPVADGKPIDHLPTLCGYLSVGPIEYSVYLFVW